MIKFKVNLIEEDSNKILIIILFIAFLIRLFYYNGWVGSDDATYFKMAKNIALGTNMEVSHWYSSRIFFIGTEKNSATILVYFLGQSVMDLLRCHQANT